MLDAVVMSSRAAIGLNVALVGLGLLASVRFWWQPRQRAAIASDEPELRELRAATVDTLASFDIAVALEQRRAEAETLRWRAPGECVEVYRFRVDEYYRDASVETFVGRPEEHATHHLALAHDPTRAPGDRLRPVIGMLTRADAEVRVRELWWSEIEVGPSAPDFACRRRSWDLLEDALALGWPKLPGTTTHVGERWTGARVEGRCHETVCLDAEGSFDRERPCRARPWSERLVGVEDELALILGEWDDDQPARAELGVGSSRELVLDEGRPLYAKAVIDHRWSGVRRELSLVRIDDCGARALADDEALAKTRARFRAENRARLRPRATD